MTEWWPQLTIDLLESDLKAPTLLEEEDDDEWELIETKMDEKKNFHLDILKNHVYDCEEKISNLRLNLCMAIFHSMVISDSVGDPFQYLSPWSSSSSICVDITSLMGEHVFSPVQDAKDIARDSFNVNGVAIQGSIKGYEGLKSMLSEEIACKTLSFSCRTFSGGIAFETVLSNFPDFEIIPRSALAEPIDILVRGDEATVRAHTMFSLTGTRSVNAFTMMRIKGGKNLGSPRVVAEEKPRSVSPRRWISQTSLAESSDDECFVRASSKSPRRLLQIAELLDTAREHVPKLHVAKLEKVSPKLRRMVVGEMEPLREFHLANDKPLRTELASIAASLDKPVGLDKTFEADFLKPAVRPHKQIAVTTLSSVLRQHQLGLLGSGFRSLILSQVKRPKKEYKSLLAAKQIEGFVTKKIFSVWIEFYRQVKNLHYEEKYIQIRKLMGFQIMTSFVNNWEYRMKLKSLKHFPN